MKDDEGTVYRLYRYAGGGTFTLATERKFNTFGEVWTHYYNDGKHLGTGYYMFVKSVPGKPDEIVSTSNVK